MKEKTFEELIEEKSPDIHFNDKHDWDLPRFSGNDMKDFGQQVREATISECEKIARQGTFSFRSLPTDRIKTEK